MKLDAVLDSLTRFAQNICSTTRKFDCGNISAAEIRFTFLNPKKGLEKSCFCDFKSHLDLFDHQTTLKDIAWILYDFGIVGI